MTRRIQHTWLAELLGVALCLSLVLPLVYAQETTKKTHAFQGKVEKVDTKAKTLTVNGENIEGWMSAMTMTYGVDKAAVIEQVKAGDQITATVYDGDFMKLYGVKVVPPPKK